MSGPSRIGTTRPRHLVALAVLGLSGCAEILADEDWYPSPRYPYPSEARVPPGQRPPSGACRIWFPDRPLGQQPPPGPCRELRRQVPYGAVLVRG